jgi:hypothetical protein
MMVMRIIMIMTMMIGLIIIRFISLIGVLANSRGLFQAKILKYINIY